MKRWVGALAVVAIAVSIVVLNPRRPGTPSPDPSGSTAQENPGASARASLSLLLIADLAEAGESCGCGEIIRMVRGAAGHGLAVREVAPGAEPDLEKRYRVTVAPTLLWLDSAGREVLRHEGESPAVVDSICADLGRLTAAQ
jgi:hypothetical protein